TRMMDTTADRTVDETVNPVRGLVAFGSARFFTTQPASTPTSQAIAAFPPAPRTSARPVTATPCFNAHLLPGRLVQPTAPSRRGSGWGRRYARSMLARRLETPLCGVRRRAYPRGGIRRGHAPPRAIREVHHICQYIDAGHRWLDDVNGVIDALTRPTLARA